MYDYPFPRDVYETDAQYLAQGYFVRHPEDIDAAVAELHTNKTARTS